jgi:RND family efflux transporter MFP subunit
MSPSMLLGRVVLPGLALALVAAVGYQWSQTGRVELPAWTAAAPATPPTRLVSDEGPRPVIAQGRVVAYPGAQVNVGAEVAGTLLRIQVAEKSVVRKGDLLLTLKSDEAKSQLDEASAHLLEAEAEVVRIEADEKKLAAHQPKGAAPSPDFERTHSYVIGYRARRDALKAARARLDAQWRKHWVFAPIDGVVTSRQVNAGETVAASAPLLTIVDLSRLRVEAEVDEYDVAHCSVGGLATIHTEAFPSRTWRGTIEEVADALVPRRIRPEDPGRPTDTRVLPVRITFREATPLRLGQRVEVSIAGAHASEEAEAAIAARTRTVR